MRKSCRSIFITSLLSVAVAANSQTLLSDFEGGADGWSGTIANNTPYANGTTAVAGVDDNGNGVVSVSDGGFGGGAVRVYSGLVPEQNVITIVADARVVRDPGNMGPNTSIGLKVDNGTGVAGDFAYSKGIGTSSDDDNQEFVRVAAAVVTGADPADVVAALTPNRENWSVSGNSWEIQLDNVHRSVGGTAVEISNLDESAEEWTGTNATNSPFPAGTTNVSHVTEESNGVVQINDGGFAGGAVGLYSAAIATPGVHTVLADVRVVSETGALTGARVAAAPGLTTNAGDLSWSASFTTPSDDSGNGFQTVAVPVETTGASDLALYLLPNFSAGVAGGNVGAWTVQVDNIRVITNQAVPVSLSEFTLE